MTKKILIAVGALAVVIAAGAAWARGPGGRHFMGKQMITQRVAHLEDLVQATPEQRATIDKAVADIVAKVQAQHQQGRNLHENVMQLLTGDSLTKEQVVGLANDHVARIQALANDIAPDIVAIHDTLTPAQRQTLAQKVQEMHQKHQKHQHAPQGGFGGPGE